MLTRPCDNQLCNICNERISPTDTACIVTVPTKKLIRLSEKTKSSLLIKWDCYNTANSFHFQCWNDVKQKLPSRKRVGTVEFNLMREVEDTVERFDGVLQIEQQAKKLAEILRNSSHTVCFTGAGISASAGIPTYRGAEGIDTIAEYGGATKRPIDESEEGPFKKARLSDNSGNKEEEEEMSYEDLQPTLSHRALAALHREGMMHFCITQNCDDLHAKGGFPRNCLSELHGNVFCEYCEVCEKEYYRDYAVDAWSTDCYSEAWFVKCPDCKFNHYTSRRCKVKKCKGKLKDTIVNFGDDLHERVLGGLPKAESECERADMCFCIGSSLTVSPANVLPTHAKKLVICNLQETDLDHKADLRVWATSDMLFTALFKELELPCPI